MENQEKRSNYWLRKWQTKNWEDFQTLEAGATFDTSVSNHVQMRGSIGDKILWYRSDKDKGIYFATEVIAEPKQDDAYQNGWSMSLRVVNTLVSNPVRLTKSGFNNLLADIDTKGQGGGTSNILEKYQPEKLWALVIGNEKETMKDFATVKINDKDIESIEKIKQSYINESAYAFNPFLDTNLAKSEVRHLYFITNLLNPKGSHLQKDKFLKLFIEELLLYDNIKDRNLLEDFCNHENIHVEVEYSIPKGRIDIWIENADYVIAIEGKTETKDSKGQLKKYDDFLKEYCKERDKKYLLCYLTKFADTPNFDEVEDVQLLGFNQNILPLMEKVKNEELPERLKSFIEEYYYALVVYILNISPMFDYELDIIEEITKNKQSYKKYENIKNNYFFDRQKYEFSVVQDIANTFEKAKAFIERDFLCDLTDNLDDYLKKEGFLFSEDSSILVNDFEENINIDITFDINTIFEKRKNRTASFKNDDIDFIREKSGINIIYINQTLENEYLRLTILNDIFGLYIHFNHVKNDECINYFENQHIELFSSNIFHSSNIEKLLDNEYRFKLIDTCKIKLLSGLKQIEV